MCADPERTNASRDANIFAPRGFARESHSGFVNFRDAIFKSKPRQTDRVPAESVRLNHTRTSRDILVMNRENPIRFTDTKLFQTTINRNTAIEQQSPHRPVATNDSCLKFSQQIHRLATNAE